MAHQLELSYNWRTPAFFATIGAFICAGAVIRGRVEGWAAAAALVVVLWVLFLGVLYLRTRAYLLVDGDRLTIRRYRGFTTIRAEDVRAVAEYLTPNGPSYRLTVRGPDGREPAAGRPGGAAPRREGDPVRVDTGRGAARRAGLQLAADRRGFAEQGNVAMNRIAGDHRWSR